MSSNAGSMVRLARPGHPSEAQTGPRRRAPRTRGRDRTMSTAGWADLLGAPSPESTRSPDMAHLGGFVAIKALVAYLTWRIAFTVPATGANAAATGVLIAFEAIPLVGMLIRMVSLWNIDSY